MKTNLTIKDLKFKGDFLTKNDKIAILEFINKNEGCFDKKRLKRVIYHHDTRLTITNARERGLRISKAVDGGMHYLYFCYVKLKDTTKKEISISDFYFQDAGDGAYLVIYVSPTTRNGWSTLVKDMTLIEATKDAATPKVKDLEKLRRIVKNHKIPYFNENI
jgi:hypothetical protein